LPKSVEFDEISYVRDIKITQTPALVRKVNELYHDAENRLYESIHPEIFNAEAKRWTEFAKRYIKHNHSPISVLDYGCGTGFVSLQLLPFLRPEDSLVCVDISAEMLNVCRNNLMSKRPPINIQFLKVDEGFNGVGFGFDFVVFNSVLHHLPDIGRFLSDLNGHINDDGYVAIGHEPNCRFYRNRTNVLLQNLLLVGVHPIKALKQRLQKMGLGDRILALSAQFSESARNRLTIYEYVNSQLIDDGFIKKPLSINQISALVDYHMPGIDRGNANGIDINALQQQWLPGHRLQFFETYNHFGTASNGNRFLQRLSDKRGRKRPLDGAQFFAVFQKKL